MSQLFIPILSLAISSSIVYYFHEFKKEDKLNEFITLLLMGISIFAGVLYIIYPLVIENALFSMMKTMNMNVELFKTYDGIILGVTYSIILFTIASTLLSNYKQIVIPQLFIGLFLKVVLAILVLLVYLGSLTLYQSALVLFGYYLLAAIVLWIYQGKYHQFKLSKISKYTRSKIRTLSEYSFYNILTGLGTSLVFRIDVIMITLLIGAKEAGYYSLFLFLANVIEIPSKGFIKIASPIISKDIKEGNISQVDQIYKKSSLNFLILGGLVALVIYAGLESLLSIMKEGDNLIKIIGVWVTLTLSKWIDMITSINSQIISYSVFYRYNLLFLIILGIINIVLNYHFIALYGLLGAAMATAISVTLYNLVKFLFIKYRFDMQPFTTDTLKGVALMGIFAVVLYMIPHVDNAYVDMIFRSGLTGLVLGGIIYQMKLSDEINSFVNNKVLKYIA